MDVGARAAEMFDARAAELGRPPRKFTSIDPDEAFHWYHVAGVDMLSDQQRRVYTEAVKGSTAAEMGRALSISPKTAENHMHAIRKRLDVGSSLRMVVRHFEARIALSMAIPFE